MEETKKVVEEMDGVRALSDEELDNVSGGDLMLAFSLFGLALGAFGKCVQAGVFDFLFNPPTMEKVISYKTVKKLNPSNVEFF